MWGTLIIQPRNIIHTSMHIIHFIIHLPTMGTGILQHPWQWPRRQSSERSNRNRDRYNPPRTTFMCVSYHQSTADKKPQRWCTNHSTPLRNSPITKCPLSLDWPWNWSYVSIMSSSRAYTTTLAFWMPSRGRWMACHSTWRSDGACKEDLDWPWRLTSVTSS